MISVFSDFFPETFLSLSLSENSPDTIPKIIPEIICDTYKIIPAAVFFSIIAPIAVIKNDGPEHTQNLIILSACFSLISPLSYNNFTHFAPTGNPPMKLNTTADTAFFGNFNILASGENAFPKYS